MALHVVTGLLDIVLYVGSWTQMGYIARHSHTRGIIARAYKMQLREKGLNANFNETIL